MNRRIPRERRRLGRFVTFSEMLADLTPKPLFDKLRRRALAGFKIALHRSEPSDRVAMRIEPEWY